MNFHLQLILRLSTEKKTSVLCLGQNKNGNYMFRAILGLVHLEAAFKKLQT